MKVLYKNKLIDGNVIIKNDLIEKVVIDIKITKTIKRYRYYISH